MNERIETIRRDIAAGTYETSDKIEKSIDPLLRDITAQGPIATAKVAGQASNAPGFGDDEPADPIKPRNEQDLQGDQMGCERHDGDPL